MAGQIKVSQLSTVTASNALTLLANEGGVSKKVQTNVANGLPNLDGTGHIPLAQIPAAVVGALQYQGVWNALTNSPALVSSVGTKGFFYKVSVAGGTTLDGNTNWHVGDFAIFDGTVWDKVNNYESVNSVFTRIGAVTAQAGDYDVTEVTGAAPLDSPQFTGFPAFTAPVGLDSGTFIDYDGLHRNSFYYDHITTTTKIDSYDITGAIATTAFVLPNTGNVVIPNKLTVGSPTEDGAPGTLTVVAETLTNQTVGVEINDVLVDLSANCQFATGDFSDERSIYIKCRTYSFVGPSSVNRAGTLVIQGAPIAGANCTFTTGGYALIVESGSVLFNATLAMNNMYIIGVGGLLMNAQAILSMAGRLQQSKGVNVAAANDLALGFGGNTFVITGSTVVNAIESASWVAGCDIKLIFTGSPTVKHNTAGGVGFASLKLAGSVDLLAAADTVLGLVYDGTYWQETLRKVA